MHLTAYFKSFDHRLWILSLGWVASALGFAVSIPYIAIYFHSHLGMSMTEIGLFFGFSAIVRAIFQAYGGELSDKYGRYHPMVISQMSRSFVFFVTAYGIYVEWGFYPIASLLVLNAMFGALFQPAGHAVIADLMPPERRIEGYSLVRVAGNLGWALGPAIGGFLADISFAILFIISGCMTMVSSLIIGIFLRNIQSVKSEEARYGFKEIFNFRENRLIFKFGSILFIMYLVVAQFMAPMSMYTVDFIGLSMRQLGILYAINGVMVVLFQIPITKIARKYRLTSQLILGTLFYTVGYFYLGYAGVFIGFVISIIIVSTGELIISPPSVTIPANLASPGHVGRYMGIYGFAVTLGWSMGPTLGGIVLDLTNPNFHYHWMMIAGLSLLAGFMFYRFRRQIPGPLDRFREH